MRTLVHPEYKPGRKWCAMKQQVNQPALGLPGERVMSRTTRICGVIIESYPPDEYYDCPTARVRYQSGTRWRVRLDSLLQGPNPQEPPPRPLNSRPTNAL
jgi:hypothetical protein